MITVFWHCEGVILVIVMLKLETVNSNAYIRTLTELSNEFSLTRIQQKSYFIMTLPGRTHVCRLRKPSQNMV